MRDNTDGTPDSGYLGTGDMLSGDVAGSAAAVCVQADGAIVLAGTAAGTTTHAALARYTSGGLGVLVNDVAPASLTVTVSDATYDETNEMSLTGSFSDPATQEPHRLVVNWGDGTPAEKFYIAPGETSFEVPARQYAQSGEYTVSVKVADSGGDSPWVSLSSPLVYSNVTPSDLQLNLSAPTIDQYQDAWLSGSFTDPGWMESRTVSIHWDDSTSDTTLTLTDGDSYFQASHPYNASGGHTITVTVADGEGSAQEAAALSVTHVAPVVEIVATDPSASETGPHAGQITLTRSGPLLDQALTVTLSVSGTAVEGTDYVTFSHTVAFAADESSTSFAVTPITEDLHGGSKTVHVSLASGSEYEPGERQSATVTIRDAYLPVLSIEATDPVADGSTAHAGQITIRRTGPTTDPLIVHLSSSGTAQAGVQYQVLPNSVTIPEGQSSYALAVTPVQNGEIDGDGLLTVTLEPSDLYSDSDYGLPDESYSSADVQAKDDIRVTIDDVTVVAGDTAVFEVHISQALDHDVTLYYHTDDGTATSGVDYNAGSGQLVISEGDTSTTISVQTLADSSNGDDETFFCQVGKDDEVPQPPVVATIITGDWKTPEGETWGLNAAGEYVGHAIAGNAGATLAQLAKRITGVESDATLLTTNGEPIRAGTKVDIGPLLRILEGRLRLNICSAVGKAKSATFPDAGVVVEPAVNWGQDEVNRIFTQGKPKPQIDCKVMAEIVMAKGLIDTLNNGVETRNRNHALDRVAGPLNVMVDHYIKPRPVSLAQTKPGDWLGFLNQPGPTPLKPSKHKPYRYWHQFGDYASENVIKLGDNWFWGWDDHAKSYEHWLRFLASKYNEGIPPIQHITAGDVPGYVRADFFVVGKIAQRVFELRIHDDD